MPYGTLTGQVAVPSGSNATYLIKPDQTLDSYAVASNPPSHYPPPAGLSGLVHLTDSGSHALYIKDDGTVGGWGNDSDSRVSGPSALTNPLYLSASTNRSYFIDQAGELTIWGDDFAGAATKPAEATGLLMATGGTWHSVALKSDGTVLAWGHNTRGQTDVPAGLSGVVEVAARGFFNLALKSDGTVVAWGYNNKGQTNVPAGLTDVKQVSCGGEFAVALKNDGTIVCWGNNAQGQCNVPAGINNAVQVTTGADYTLVVLDDATVVWFGYDGSLTGEQIPPAGTAVYYPTEDPTGAIKATLVMTASLSGEVTVTGDISAALPFSVALSGGAGAGGDIDASLGFSASFAGTSVTKFGVVGASLGFTAKMVGYQDWISLLDPVALQEIYELTLTGAADGLPDLTIPVSSWQATYQAAPRQVYVQGVVPAAETLIASMSARSNGEIIIRKGYRFSDGTKRTDELLRSGFETFRYDRGPSAFTATISGYRPGDAAQNGTRELSGIRSLSFSNGKYRARVDIDLFLRPGMTVSGAGVAFRADYINYYVASTDKFCEVSER